MTRRELAVSFIRLFCEGRLEGLRALLTEDFRFQGPYLTSESREDYLSALEADPPLTAEFELYRVFEDGEDICLIYDYRKPGRSLLMAQWTRFRGQRIKSITLLFDGSTPKGGVE